MVNQYCAHSFARNWQLFFLNQQEGENDCRNHFMIQRLLLTQWETNLQPPDHQLDSHPTEPPRPAALYGNWMLPLLEILHVMQMITGTHETQCQKMYFQICAPSKLRSAYLMSLIGVLWIAKYSEPSLQGQHLFPKTLPLKWICCCREYLMSILICKILFCSYFLIEHMFWIFIRITSLRQF